MVMEMVRAAEGSDEAEEEGLAKADAGRALSECAPLIGERKQSGGATILGIREVVLGPSFLWLTCLQIIWPLSRRSWSVSNLDCLP